MKKDSFYRITLLLLLLIISTSTFSQTISPVFFGQNAWMPDSIGSKKFSGQLHSKWQDVKHSSAQLIRFGGIGADDNMPTNHQYIKMIDSIRTNGMEPMIQVPFYKGKYNASQAAAIVEFINITKGKKIKYWVIGNEPDHAYGYSSSSQVAPYFKAYASAMKAVDPSIKIVGPETAWYNTNIINGLTTPGGSDDITGKDGAGRYYVDIISFHTYPFNGSQNRSSVISNLTSPGKFQDNLATLNARIADCNMAHGRTGNNALKTAVTEANINWQNDESDNVYGVGAASFIGGQFWVEMMGIALGKSVEFFNFWSVIEGNSQALNIGYIDKYNGNRQPTFYHFKMMAENFKGTYCEGSDNQSNIKVFGSKNAEQISVMILNQSQGNNYNYTLRLNSGNVSGNNDLKININASVDMEYTDHISNQSTILLVFNLNGTLIKKCEYKLEGHANANLPPSCIDYSNPTSSTVIATPRNLPGLKIYPNPAKNEFTLDFNSGNSTEENVSVKMIDHAGRVVLYKEFELMDKQVKEQVKLAEHSIATGTYIIQLQSGDEIYNSRIVVTP